MLKKDITTTVLPNLRPLCFSEPCASYNPVDLHAALDYENRNGDTAAFAAARIGAHDALSALLAAGAKPHHENNFGSTALSAVLKVDVADLDTQKCETSLRLLVKFGAGPNQESTFGNTAAAQAAAGGHYG